MEAVLQTWRNYLVEARGTKKGVLPLDVIDYLIKEYARNPGGPVDLKRGYFEFSNFGPEYAEEFKDTAASYLAPGKLMLINVEVVGGNGIAMINAVIHEIFHYNQHMKWDTADANGRRIWVGAHKLPSGYSRKNLEDLDFFTLISFWREYYGYEKAPHEIEAYKWADAHTRDAVNKVVDREHTLKKQSKRAIKM